MTGTRAARKARNAQRQADRARHRSDDLENWAARAEAEARLDAVIARCEGCGLEQVSSGAFAKWRRDLDDPAGVCVLCGSPAGAFVAAIDGNPVR